MAVVGVFDSGVGGLSVVRRIFQKVPEVKIIYYGDTARVPYGGKNREELVYLADVVTGFLLQEGADLIVDACNSTSAVAIEYLQQKYGVPILGVIEPGVRAALLATLNNRIGLIATEATVKSGIHAKMLGAANPNVKLFDRACPGFVPLIESGDVTSSQIGQLAKEYLGPLQGKNIDTLILGCTHYPFLEPVLAKTVGPDIKLVDPAVETIVQLEKLLATTKKNVKNESKHRFIVSGDPENFKQVANSLPIGIKLVEVERVFIE